MRKVFVNGTFDIIHLGHLALFNYAKSLGDFLLVAIDSDKRVKQLKGNDRPINNQIERKTLLENLKAIDETNAGDLKQTVLEFAQSLSTLNDLQRGQVIEKIFGSAVVVTGEVVDVSAEGAREVGRRPRDRGEVTGDLGPRSRVAFSAAPCVPLA
jgi:cytidyltransferase-like protein